MLDGVSRCARYAFGPNRLHYCGPDANQEVLAYLNEGVADAGLTQLLVKFKTLYPYLEMIAHANCIEDIFDARVVEAYWLGNRLLDSIGPAHLYHHFTESLELKRKVPSHSLNALHDKLHHRPSPHHNFHVLNIWQRTGNMAIDHTLESLDQCRISWGKVIKIDGPIITVTRQPLTFSNCHPALDAGSRNKKQRENDRIDVCFDFLDSRFHGNDNRLVLASPVPTKITRRLDDNSLMEDVAIGDVISIHWAMPCEILSDTQLSNLKKYTRQSLQLANLSL